MNEEKVIEEKPIEIIPPLERPTLPLAHTIQIPQQQQQPQQQQMPSYYHSPHNVEMSRSYPPPPPVSLPPQPQLPQPMNSNFPNQSRMMGPQHQQHQQLQNRTLDPNEARNKMPQMSSIQFAPRMPPPPQMIQYPYPISQLQMMPNQPRPITSISMQPSPQLYSPIMYPMYPQS